MLTISATHDLRVCGSTVREDDLVEPRKETSAQLRRFTSISFNFFNCVKRPSHNKTWVVCFARITNKSSISLTPNPNCEPEISNIIYSCIPICLAIQCVNKC